jgi:hypothetical protein
MKTEVESLKELVQLFIAKIEFLEAENAALRAPERPSRTYPFSG